MSSLFVHAMTGVLLAMAARVDWRLVLPVAFMAVLPDVDHLWGDGGRSYFHTFWFLVVAPALAAGCVLWMRRVPAAWRRAAAAAPALLFSHLLLDAFPHASEGASPRLPLLLPFDHRDYSLVLRGDIASDPLALTSIGIVLGSLAVLIALSWAVAGLVFRLETGFPWRARLVATAFAMAWAPALFLAIGLDMLQPM